MPRRQIEDLVRYSGLVSFGIEPDFHYLDKDQEALAEKLIVQLEELFAAEANKQ